MKRFGIERNPPPFSASFGSIFDRGSRGGRASRSGHSGRGGCGARGGRGGRSHVVAPDIVKHPLGQHIETISNSMLESKTDDPAVITDCKYIASYSWLEGDDTTILVPGKPPRWTPLKHPRKLDIDRPEYLRDPNAAKYPTYPTEPAVQAVLKSDPSFETSDIDIFACGSTLGNLLRFVRKYALPFGEFPKFRFNVERIGSTVFFIRKENDPKELIRDVKGYGHTFPEAYTTWDADVKGSDIHQRIIRYSFGGLECLVRFECDGYLATAETKQVAAEPTVDQKDDDDALIQAFQSASISHSTSDKNSHLTVKTAGSPVPQDAIFDLKTRSSRAKFGIDMSDVVPRLYINQIPNFIAAFHDGEGTFPTEAIKVQNLQEDLRTWESDNHDALARLSNLLTRIITLTLADEKGLLEIYCPELDKLEIRKQYGDGSHALPPELQRQWAGLSGVLLPHTESDEGPQTINLDKWGRKYMDELTSDEDYAGGDGDSEDGDLDFTACDADSCGYCGKCSY